MIKYFLNNRLTEETMSNWSWIIVQSDRFWEHLISSSYDNTQNQWDYQINLVPKRWHRRCHPDHSVFNIRFSVFLFQWFFQCFSNMSKHSFIWMNVSKAKGNTIPKFNFSLLIFVHTSKSRGQAEEKKKNEMKSEGDMKTKSFLLEKKNYWTMKNIEIVSYGIC